MAQFEIEYGHWKAEARNRYGELPREVRFRCPGCGYVQTLQDFVNLGMSAEEASTKVGFSCIGRWKPGPVQDAFTGGPGPCNYAGGGLFNVSPIVILFDDDEHCRIFDFADDPLVRGESLVDALKA